MLSFISSFSKTYYWLSGYLKVVPLAVFNEVFNKIFNS